MKYINFKHITLKLSLLASVFICSLMASSQVLAGEQSFVLTTHQYSGTGVISKSLAKPAKGLRADRAMMATKHKKRVSAELVSTDGAKLACELNMAYGDIWGQCVDPNNQQTFTIKTLVKEAK
jgi:hypothetical protein